MASKKTQYITNAALIAALYVVMTFLANMVGLASGAIQVRLSEALNMLVCFTPAAVPGMFVGCIAANLLTEGVPLDLIFGSLATLIGVAIGRKIATINNDKFKMLVPIPTILSNALIVPLVLQKGYGIDLPFHYLLATVGIGEIISAGFLGLMLYFALMKVPQFRRATIHAVEDNKMKSAQKAKRRTEYAVKADREDIEKEN